MIDRSALGKGQAHEVDIYDCTVHRATNIIGIFHPTIKSTTGRIPVSSKKHDHCTTESEYSACETTTPSGEASIVRWLIVELEGAERVFLKTPETFGLDLLGRDVCCSELGDMSRGLDSHGKLMIWRGSCFARRE
jgi:hypothetical protein